MRPWNIIYVFMYGGCGGRDGSNEERLNLSEFVDRPLQPRDLCGVAQNVALKRNQTLI